MTPEREKQLRDYARGDVTWRELRERGFADYVEVLGGLGELGLRPPIATMAGPNLAARERGRSILRELLAARLPAFAMAPPCCCSKIRMSPNVAPSSTNA